MGDAPGIYNAVIRDDLKILGRTHLTDPKHVPWWWEIRDWNSGKEIVTMKDLKEPGDASKGSLEPPVYPDKPLQIMKRKPFLTKATTSTQRKDEQEIRIYFSVKETGKEIPLNVKASNTLEEVRWKLSRLMGVEEPPLWGLVLGETQLFNKLRSTMVELGVNEDNNHFKYLPESEIPEKESLGSGNAIVAVGHELVGERGRVEVSAFKLWTYSNIGQLKHLIWKKTGIPAQEQSLSLCGIHSTPPLKDDQILQEFPPNRSENEQAVYVMHLERYQTQFGAVQGKRLLNDDGIKTIPDVQDNWMAYGAGVNIKGHCENKRCKSQEEGWAVIVTLGLGNGLTPLVLKGDLPIACSACGEETFQPKSFMISGASCAFQYKMPGDRMIKSLNVGSGGPFPAVAHFEHPEDKRDHEYVEIRVRPWNHVPYDCFWCARRIGNVDDAVTNWEGCGHRWHRYCNPQVICAICAAEEVAEIDIRRVCK